LFGRRWVSIGILLCYLGKVHLHTVPLGVSTNFSFRKGKMLRDSLLQYHHYILSTSNIKNYHHHQTAKELGPFLTHSQFSCPADASNILHYNVICKSLIQ
jgi:hypothetical protein